MKGRFKEHSGEGQPRIKTTGPSDRAGGGSRDARRSLSDDSLRILRGHRGELFKKLGSHPLVGRSIRAPRHKQPFWVRLYVSLVRVEFDSARIYGTQFHSKPLWDLFKVLVRQVKLSDQKRIIKDYSQLRLNLYIDCSFAARPELRSVERYFRASLGIKSKQGWIVGRRCRKFRHVALELFQFKKVTIQDSEKENSTREESIAKHKAMVGGNPVPVREEYRERFRRVVRDLLESNGFSFDYEDCIRGLPGSSSSTEVKAGEGGLRMGIRESMIGTPSYPAIITPEGAVHFAGQVTHLWRNKGPKVCRVVSCSDTFKDRIITIHPETQYCLKPLQQKLLSFLGNLDCFCIGKDSLFDFVDGMKSRPGGTYCSGDYSCATDTFASELSEIVLEEVVGRVNFRLGLDEDELEEFKQYIVYSTTRWTMEYGEEEVFQQRGQLMGTLLSFPVLNIYNYAVYACLYEEMNGVVVTFKDIVDWVRINGDDILFNEDDDFCDFWCDGVGRYGMTLNKDKTGRSKLYGSLNSHYFRFGLTTTMYESQGVVILHKEGGKSEGIFKKNTWAEKARAIFALRGWKCLTYLFKLHRLERMEFRKFFGPRGELETLKEEEAIFKCLNEGAEELMKWSLRKEKPYNELIDLFPLADELEFDENDDYHSNAVGYLFDDFM